MLYANKDHHVIFQDELEEISTRYPTFTITYIFSPDHVTRTNIKKLIPNFTQKIYYVSGPEEMVENLLALLKTMGISETNFKGDRFPNYPEI